MCSNYNNCGCCGGLLSAIFTLGLFGCGCNNRYDAYYAAQYGLNNCGGCNFFGSKSCCNGCNSGGSGNASYTIVNSA